ncbi:MAG TPA: hypothetical protein VHI13_02880 [Candidatus Kapabacteria bacterium]|nr:hypothetical protein [Candidatus Kapabacteria bacterium]
MKKSLNISGHALVAALVLALVPALGGCKSDSNPTGPNYTITDDNVAQLVGMAYARQGGFLMTLGDAIDVVHGAPLPLQKAVANESTQYQSTVTRNRSTTVAGKTYSYSGAVDYDVRYTTNSWNNGRDTFWAENTELRFFAIMKRGTIVTPTFTGTDSAGAGLFFLGTNQPSYTLSGRFGRVGSYTFFGDSNRTVAARIEYENMPGVTIDPVGRIISDNNIGMALAVNLDQKDGKHLSYQATMTIRTGQPPRLNLAGKTYVINVDTGEAVLQ